MQRMGCNHSPDEIAGNMSNIWALINLNYPRTLRIKNELQYK